MASLGVKDYGLLLLPRIRQAPYLNAPRRLSLLENSSSLLVFFVFLPGVLVREGPGKCARE